MQVREGRDWVGEKHDAEPRKDSVERRGSERVDLGIGLFEADVEERCGVGVSPSAFDHLRGQVDT
jgi:hypothetical protein